MAILAVRLIICIDLFLLTFAVGINAHTFVVWYMSHPSYGEYESAGIGRSC